ncbi:PHP domain-containing protein [Tepidibacillus marianensis]|uniref:PHP domain-containing protein n=1 Tax=Tepidibacillus marianensis TaxID=3131995 RepID=UPI0030CA64BB
MDRLKADLHSHSTASDGLNSPADNIKLAKGVGLAALGITDHDSVAGIDEAVQMANEIGIEAIPGIEISTVENGQDVHVLGYFIHYKDQAFLDRLEELQTARDRRNEMMLEKLNELGIKIKMKEVRAKIRRDGANIGRPHIAEVLIDKGVVKTMEGAFKMYLGKDGKAYVNPIRIAPEVGIDIIKEAGGIPVLAHPGLYHDDEMVIRLVQYGLKGIEVYHPDHSEEEEQKYQEIIDQYGILATAGSDFHGSRKGVMFHAPMGTKTVSYEIVEKMKSML